MHIPNFLWACLHVLHIKNSLQQTNFNNAHVHVRIVHWRRKSMIFLYSRAILGCVVISLHHWLVPRGVHWGRLPSRHHWPPRSERWRRSTQTIWTDDKTNYWNNTVLLNLLAPINPHLPIQASIYSVYTCKLQTLVIHTHFILGH